MMASVQIPTLPLHLGQAVLLSELQSPSLHQAPVWGRINWHNVYKAPNGVPRALQSSVICTVGRKADAGHISTVNVVGCECDLLVGMTLILFASESSLSIIYDTATTTRQREYHCYLPKEGLPFRYRYTHEMNVQAPFPSGH